MTYNGHYNKHAPVPSTPLAGSCSVGSLRPLGSCSVGSLRPTAFMPIARNAVLHHVIARNAVTKQSDMVICHCEAPKEPRQSGTGRCHCEERQRRGSLVRTTYILTIPLPSAYLSLQKVLEVPSQDSRWRHRLGVRIGGSQPSDRGSIPRGATISCFL